VDEDKDLDQIIQLMRSTIWVSQDGCVQLTPYIATENDGNQDTADFGEFNPQLIIGSFNFTNRSGVQQEQQMRRVRRTSLAKRAMNRINHKKFIVGSQLRQISLTEYGKRHDGLFWSGFWTLLAMVSMGVFMSMLASATLRDFHISGRVLGSGFTAFCLAMTFLAIVAIEVRLKYVFMAISSTCIVGCVTFVVARLIMA
jgi:hypothetical protein